MEFVCHKVFDCGNTNGIVYSFKKSTSAQEFYSLAQWLHQSNFEHLRCLGIILKPNQGFWDIAIFAGVDFREHALYVIYKKK